MVNFFRELGRNCLELTFAGDQDQQTVSEFIKEVDGYIDGHKLQRQVMRYLIDVSELGKTTVSARMEAALILRNRPFHKMAIYGQNFYAKHLVGFILRASRKIDQAQFFSEKARALDWISRAQ